MDRNLAIPAQLPGSATAAEKKQQRMLTKDGVFVSRDILNSGDLGDLSPKDGVRPRFEGESYHFIFTHMYFTLALLLCFCAY